MGVVLRVDVGFIVLSALRVNLEFKVHTADGQNPALPIIRNIP